MLNFVYATAASVLGLKNDDPSEEVVTSKPQQAPTIEQIGLMFLDEPEPGLIVVAAFLT